MRFDGHITGLGTASGTRIVVGQWDRSPLGPFADAMIEDEDGHRTLLAPTADVADLVSTTYSFDSVRVEAVRTDGWSFAAGPLHVSWTPGRRVPIGHVLRVVPPRIGRSPRWARMCDPVARRLMPGVRTYGTAGGGRTEWYAARDSWRVVQLAASWDGRDLGPLADVDPPVHFGFGSSPRRPAVTRLSSFVRLP